MKKESGENKDPPEVLRQPLAFDQELLQMLLKEDVPQQVVDNMQEMKVISMRKLAFFANDREMIKTDLGSKVRGYENARWITGLIAHIWQCATYTAYIWQCAAYTAEKKRRRGGRLRGPAEREPAN